MMLIVLYELALRLHFSKSTRHSAQGVHKFTLFYPQYTSRDFQEHRVRRMAQTIRGV